MSSNLNSPDALMLAGFVLLFVSIIYSVFWKMKKQNLANTEAVLQNDLEMFWSTTHRFFPETFAIGIGRGVGLLLIGIGGYLATPNNPSWIDVGILIFGSLLIIQTLMTSVWFFASRKGSWAENQDRFLAKIVHRRFERLRNQAPKMKANSAGVFD